jgi:hypothetical protein
VILGTVCLYLQYTENSNILCKMVMIAFRNPVSNGVRFHSYYLQMQYKIAVYTNVCSNCYTVKVQHHRACGRLLLLAKTVTANSSSLN